MNTVTGLSGTTAANPGRDEMERNIEAAREVVLKTADMLDGLPSTDIPVPRSEWTVGEQGAHIAFANIGFGMFAMGLEYPHGDGTKAGLAEANDVALYGFPVRDGSELAGHLRQGIDTFIAAARAGDPDQDCPSPLGHMPLGTLTSYFLIHNLMHGCAIASGLNQDFPVNPEHVFQVWPLVLHAFPSFVNPSAGRGLSGCVQVKVPGALEAAFYIENSQLSVLPPNARPADCVVTADAVHFFLVLVKILDVQEAVDLGHMTISGSDPGLFSRVMNAIDVP